MRTLAFSAAAMFVVGSMVSAGEVTVEGVHLCCGGCVKDATAAFKDVDGISNVSVDKDAGKVTYDATDAKTARKGLQALAKAGYGGKAKHAGKDLKFPKGFKEDGKGDSVTIRGAHNCCGGCAKAITGALEKVDGVSKVECKKNVCTVTGKDVEYSKLIAALHDAGLHGNIGGGKKKNDE